MPPEPSQPPASSGAGDSRPGTPPAPMVESLLSAIVRSDGDALVMHAGEKPYVIGPSGSVELSARPLTLEALGGMLGQLLPAPTRQVLDVSGAAEHAFEPFPDGDRFIVVAARGGDDLWVEIRRYRSALVEPEVAPVPEPIAAEPMTLPEQAIDPEPLRRDRHTTWPAAISEPQPGVVVPLLRTPRPEPAPSLGQTRPPGLDRLLRVATARGASTLYIVADSRPLVRVDGEIATLDTEPVIGTSDVETLLLDLAPEPTRDALRSGMVTEWICDVPDVGQVRCTSFHDHRGPGGIFRLLPARTLSADQLGLSREIQALGSHPDGLVLIAGRRASGKSTLMSAFVDLINRTRNDHVITIESQIKFVHEGRRAFISQREVRGGHDEMARAVRAALREDPDVLVIDDLQSAEMTMAALEAAESGRLVVAAIAAPTTTVAVERLVDQFPAERRAHVRQMLSATLRGAVAQVLLRKTGGGRLAARELLLNTPAVANLIAEGKSFQLPLALDSGRRHGMVPLNDALVAFVQSGATDPREAYRRAFDREGLLTLLKRAGVDTSFIERLA